MRATADVRRALVRIGTAIDPAENHLDADVEDQALTRMLDIAWEPPYVNVVLSGGPVEARFEDDPEPAPRRYVGFKQPTASTGDPLLWEGDQA